MEPVQIVAFGIPAIIICVSVAFLFTWSQQAAEHDRRVQKEKEEKEIELNQRREELLLQLKYVIENYPRLINEAIEKNENQYVIASMEDLLKTARRVDDNLRKGLWSSNWKTRAHA